MGSREFLSKSVGDDYITTDENERISVKPYGVIKTVVNTDEIIGHITFKDETFQTFNCNPDDYQWLEAVLDSLNYGYSQGIKDAMTHGNVHSDSIKPLKFT